MTYTLATANALLYRMAFAFPWHPGFCGACGGTAWRHNDGPMPKSPRNCPLVPIDDGADRVAEVGSLLRAKVARAEFGGAGVCFACHAFLPHGDANGIIENARQYHNDKCEVAALLGPLA